MSYTTEIPYEVVTTKLSFSQALTHIKDGVKMQRTGWNGKGMFLSLIKGRDVILQATKDHEMLPMYDFIIMKTADNKIVPWLASQTDILAEDWQTATN